MRPAMIGDVLAAARVVYRLPDAARAGVVVQMLAEADRADRHRRATGRAHPTLGNGSLMAVALARGAAVEPSLTDPGWIAALIVVLGALRVRADRGQKYRGEGR